jgi:hypothetical protein
MPDDMTLTFSAESIHFDNYIDLARVPQSCFFVFPDYPSKMLDAPSAFRIVHRAG